MDKMIIRLPNQMVTIWRPAPPTCYVLWKPNYVKVCDTRMPVCPYCGANGYYMKGGGYTDPGAQAVYDQAVAAGWRMMGAGDSSVSYEGVPIGLHWSRYSIGGCNRCEKLKLWFDMGGAAFDAGGKYVHVEYPLNEWRRYYQPFTGQLSLF